MDFKKNTKMSWLNYAVTITLGIAFSLILVFITWNNAIDSRAREFELATSSIKDTVARNVQTSNDTLKSLSSFLEVSPNLSQSQYDTVTSSLLGLHPFMEGSVYATRLPGTGMTEKPYTIRYQSMRSSNNIDVEQELLDDEAYTNALNILSETDAVITLSSGYSNNGWKGYWILHAVRNAMNQITGFVAILINSNRLVGANIGDNDLSITLLSDSASLSGRQLLFQDRVQTGGTWFAGNLLDESITQFPYYSVRLSVSRNISWGEIEKTMTFISLLIGAGVTLLLVALVKSKDEREQQLRERNAIIEAQVLAQTEELAKARDHALEASLMKSSFLASMSHEIRTPLNAIIGMSDLLSETELDFEQKKYVAVFKKAGDTLLSLVNDILDLSKIEANQLKLEEIEFSLIDTIEESVEIYALKAAEKSIELICDIQADLKTVRFGDPTRLRQVLLNLISNALKFTDEGEICVSVRQLDENDQDSLEITVTDTGTGIPEDKLERIFESFSQADSSTTRKYGGTGLGLTISRRLIEMMGGRIWVESTLGSGSRFIIQVSLPVIEGQKDPAELQACIDGCILIVDDNQRYRDILKAYLEGSGARILAADGYDTAVEVIESGQSGDIRLILVDAEMPGKDGFSLVRRLQQMQIRSSIIMMLNPSTLNQNQRNLDDLGIDDTCLTKPVKLREMQKMVNTVLKGGDRDTDTHTASNDPETVRPLKILLVDDNPDNRLLVRAYLKRLPYQVDEAENGEEAIGMFMEHSYDVVLMDVQMPVMDGREATRKIREWENREARTPVPIIALTAHAVKEEIDRCFEAGCDSHLSKPVKKETLINTIQTISSVSN